MTSNILVRNAVRHALVLSATAAASATTISSYAADEESATLSEVVVTGSRIRRVDAETANPIITIDSAAIAQSGASSTAEFIAKLPAIAGAATNPQVNNGGGFGEANIELRGLDARRTLILLNGRRVGLAGASDAVDVNQIPMEIIDHVDVLKEGAGAIYGSDAIAGVVNFVTRKSVDGLEVSADYGRTSRSDGQHYSASLLWGASSETSSFILGGRFEKQEAISSGDRDFSKFALYLYSGSVFQGGSSRTPNGRINLPAGNSFGCPSVTRIAGAAGSALSDYRCYVGATDAFNYQPYNLVLTPQERSNVFATLTHKINDAVETYAEILMNRTHSGFQIAPLPFDATADDVVVSANSMYNPFGIDFGGQTTGNPNVRVRMLSLGTRRSDTVSDSKLVTAGLRGENLFGTDWRWDLSANVNRLDQAANVSGYLFQPGLDAAFGPSFMSATGVPTCGTPTAPISNCTPVNIFNIFAPGQAAALRTISSAYDTNNTSRTAGGSLSLDGTVAHLPAGDLKAAVGADYRTLEGSYKASSVVQAAPPFFAACYLAQETCTGDSAGKYSVKEIFVEGLIPILKEVPGAYALNASVGARYSDYSLFGSTTRSEFKLEYRPIKDLLIRGGYQQVFRAPTVADISAAPFSSNPTFNDPCVGLTAAMVTANPNLALACVGVPRDGSFGALGTSQISALVMSNPNLKPETGNVITYGLVYEPEQVRGLSFTLDFWRYKIEDLITTIDPNFAISQCVATGASQFCGLVNRFTFGANAGQVFIFQTPASNLGELKTNGVDMGVKYRFETGAAGTFGLSLDATRLSSYENTPAPGASPVEVAGTYDRQFGNYAKWRGIGSVAWTLKDVDALLSVRYVDKIQLLDPDGAPGTSPPLNIDSFTYLDLSVGYNLPGDVKLQLGAKNLTDKQPPIMYQNNVINGNTDVQTYDGVGRQYWMSLKHKF